MAVVAVVSARLATSSLVFSSMKMEFLHGQ